MIDTSLNRRYNAEAGMQQDFSPAPEGEYILRVVEVKPWVAKKQDIMVIQKDENGRTIIDEKGEKIRVKVPNCEFYNSSVKLEIVGGEHDGKFVFYNLTTHPNMEFSIPSFLYGIGMKSLAASEIPTAVIGCKCLAYVIVDTYTKKKIDKDTGLEVGEEKKVNRIKSFLEPIEETMPTEDDLGI